MPDVNQKKKLASLNMPGTSPEMPGADTTPANPAVQQAVQGGQDNSAASKAPAYTDTETGKQYETEPGLEEGDLYFDYIAPVKNLFTGGLVAAGKAMANATASKGVDALKNKMPPPALNYGKGGNMSSQGPGESGYALSYKQGGSSGQMGPGNTTRATTGFNNRPGIKAVDQDEVDLAPLGK